jgi:hypothetical protein
MRKLKCYKVPGTRVENKTNQVNQVRL